ncbi:MAG: MCE family protein [Actinomycetota bacterium]|nr:MCE family protein [Actinomycetota bacterium]
MRQVLIGLIGVALVAAAFGVTGYTLVNGGLTNSNISAYAEFSNCGQGLRERGDVKLRGVLVGIIEGVEKVRSGNCKVELGIFPDSQDQVPQNVGAEIRAKTVFGEKWVELLYPTEPVAARLGKNDVIEDDQTLDPIEVETILNTALPLLESIDPENLAATLEALSTGFVGHEEAAIRGIESGIKALEPLNNNEGLLNEGITQLKETGKTFQNVDDDLFLALDRLDVIQRFTIDKEQLIASNFEKVPRLLDELTLLFNTRFEDFTRLVNNGATIVDILAARRGDLDKLLTFLPQFNAKWIRNLSHNCRYRQDTDEPGKHVGDEVPGRCWRVHNIISTNQPPYTNEDRPRPYDDSDLNTHGGRSGRKSSSSSVSDSELESIGAGGSSDMGRVLGTPALTGGDR